MKFFLIGIDDNPEQRFSPETEQIISSHRIFSGGLRHHRIVRNSLPEGSQWIQITIPLSLVFSAYRLHEEIVVFVSGDPLFYGFAQTIQNEIPTAGITVFPAFNSLQMLAHRLLLPYQDMHVVSLTGRPWHKFDEALICGYPLIGVLTDNREHTPGTIAARMLDYGYNNYRISVGESLGNPGLERYNTYSLPEILQKEFLAPNNLILEKTEERPRLFGIPENNFSLFDGRSKMITKMPVRLLTLSLLNLYQKHVFWDIGSCTGSVSVEAKLQFPHLEIIAFEQRPEGKDLLEQNARKFGTPGIQVLSGDFTTLGLNKIPSPDAVFIGGHGGKMQEIIARLSPILPDGATVVFNSVSKESRELFLTEASREHLTLETSVRIQIDHFNAIEVIKTVLKRNLI